MRKNMGVHFNEIFVITFYQLGVFLLESEDDSLVIDDASLKFLIAL